MRNLASSFCQVPYPYYDQLTYTAALNRFLALLLLYRMYTKQILSHSIGSVPVIVTTER
jgi:hypothetical protein